MRQIKLIFISLFIFVLSACTGADVKNISSASARTAYDFELPDQDGKLWKLSDVLKGHRAVVLAFYPKDDTKE
jgi:cytochrome oxidase Cu insertion factor (SCO1/SenC/PrrC family)